MNKKQNIPVFSVDFTDDSIWNSISIVDFPAVEENFIKLAKQSEVKFSIDGEKREISGPAIIPDKEIYRNDERGEYYIKFSKDVIKKMAIQFFARGTQNNGNVMHEVDVPGVTFFESYLIDKGRGINPTAFEELPDGTWIVSAHIENDDLWKLIVDGELRGFSIDCTAVFKEDKKELETLDDFYNYLNNK